MANIANRHALLKLRTLLASLNLPCEHLVPWKAVRTARGDERRVRRLVVAEVRAENLTRPGYCKLTTKPKRVRQHIEMIRLQQQHSAVPLAA